MLYELIEMTKESLTQCNLPHGQCVVCLENFELGQPFTRTPCYHYFHCQCLLRYVTHCLAQLKADDEEQQSHSSMRHQQPQEQKQVICKGNFSWILDVFYHWIQVVCPVCREPISSDVQALDKGHIKEEDIHYVPSPEMQLLQKKMAELFQVQKARGGIIDLEEERNKFLVPAVSVSNL